ncbi:MAG: ATP-binding cassette domain-containing protein [Clostridia bacterium]|nr:ATP-binding cassette domain-containing protein [Clostridia bacterium]
MEILTVENLSFTYPLANSPIIKDISFSIGRGEFTLLCGATGSGKSTLLRLLTGKLAPNGERHGRILLDTSSVCDLSFEKIGFVTQRPDEQIVTDKVYSELAFGLENMGLERGVIARRIAEIAAYFGIEDWFDRDVSTLSGGQKQLLNLASVMVTDPDVLILDEPTSQLDPIATADFLSTIKRLNRELSLTVIIAEHRLEELVPMCDRILVMDKGRIVNDGTPRDVANLVDVDGELFLSMPTATRLYRSLCEGGDVPLTQADGRRFIEENYGNKIRILKKERAMHSNRRALEFKDVYFRYERELPDVLRGLSFTVYEGETFCILGGNGSGKTTALAAAAGLRKIYSGQIRVFDKKIKEYTGQELYRNCITLMPQDVQSVFLRNSVREELEDAGVDLGSLPFDLSPLMERHPYDLSGGEQQLVALAKVLATRPRLLLMDEPTKGLDSAKKNELDRIIRALKSKGVTVLIVTHDVEFAALCADRCALFFRGDIVSCAEPDEFFSQNSFYTTVAARMTKGYFDNTVTVEDVAELCRQNRESELAR